MNITTLKKKFNIDPTPEELLGCLLEHEIDGDGGHTIGDNYLRSNLSQTEYDKISCNMITKIGDTLVDLGRKLAYSQ